MHGRDCMSSEQTNKQKKQPHLIMFSCMERDHIIYCCSLSASHIQGLITVLLTFSGFSP